MSVIRSTKRSAWRLAAIGAVATLGLVACSSGGTSRSNAGVAQQQPDAAQPAQGGAAQQPPAAGDKAAPPARQPGVPAQYSIDTRSMIFTGTVTVRVTDVERAAADTSSIATAAGGFVGGDERTSAKDRSQARLTLRVPSARFSSVVDSVAKLGREESRQLSTEDVTDQVTDVDARIATGQASVDRVRDLLAKAANISEIVSLESELSRREADLESLKSRKRKLDDQTTLSTITAILLGPEAAAKPAPKHETGFLAGLTSGWHSFTTSMGVLATVVGALLPWLVALAVPVAVALWWIRRTRRLAASSASASASE
jgi:Domain of unknown function (DUF4349)